MSDSTTSRRGYAKDFVFEWIIDRNPCVDNFDKIEILIANLTPREATKTMTQAPQQRQTHLKSSSPSTKKQIDSHSERLRRGIQRDELARKCQIVFDRVYSQLIENHYNWHIAIDPDTEQYLIDPTLMGITAQIKDTYEDRSTVKLTIFRLNETGTCGRL